MEHKGDRKKIVTYWQQLSEVERSMREQESVQEEKERAIQKETEWNAGNLFPLFKKTAQLCICQTEEQYLCFH